MSNPTIPAHLYQRVTQLVEQGHSVEDALTKAVHDPVSTPAQRRATGAPEDESTLAPELLASSVSLRDALTIRVNGWTPPTLKQGGGVNAHTHWRNKHRVEKHDHRTGRDAAEPYAGWECPDMPVLVAVIHWESVKRKKDADNALNSVKHLVDGICRTLGIDDKRFVTSMAFQRIDKNRNGFVDIIIRPATREERQLAA